MMSLLISWLALNSITDVARRHNQTVESRPSLPVAGDWSR
jgi:hypothetical protein